MVCLAAEPMMRMRDVAVKVGITERAVQRIVSELESAGALTRTKVGRQNRYEINRDLALRHGLESHHTLGELLDAVL